MDKNLNAPVNSENVRNNQTVPPVPPTAKAAAPKNQAIPEAAKKLKKEGNGGVVSGVITGVATGVGALAGAVAGSFAANAVNRPATGEENPDDVIVTTVTDPEEDDVEVTVVDGPQQQTTSTTNVTTTTVEEPVTESEIEVVEYQHINAEDGSEMDLVVLSVDGTEVGVVDVDMDGRADVMMADVNGDGEIDETEVVTLDDVDIAMVDLINAMPQQEPVGGAQYAQTDLDYTNDANVDSYFA